MLGRRFELISRIGSGRTRDRWLARDLERGGEDVAIALIDAEVEHRIGALDRAERELELLSSTHLEHVARPIAWDLDGDPRFVALAWVAGVSLGLELRLRSASGRHYPIQDALAVARAIASGIAGPHDHGVIHGELEPDEVMLPWSGTPKVEILNFGVARLSRAANAESTEIGRDQSGALYLAPERLRGAEDSRSDVFAVGAVLFELLTLRRAFARDAEGRPLPLHLPLSDGRNDPLEIAARAQSGPRPAPSLFRDDVPAELDRVIRSALSADPSERPEDGRSLLAELDRASAAAGRGGGSTETMHDGSGGPASMRPLELPKLVVAADRPARRAPMGAVEERIRGHTTAPAPGGAPRPPSVVAVSHPPPAASRPLLDPRPTHGRTGQLEVDADTVRIAPSPAPLQFSGATAAAAIAGAFFAAAAIAVVFGGDPFGHENPIEVKVVPVGARPRAATSTAAAPSEPGSAAEGPAPRAGASPAEPVAGSSIEELRGLVDALRLAPEDQALFARVSEAIITLSASGGDERLERRTRRQVFASQTARDVEGLARVLADLEAAGLGASAPLP